VGSRGVLVKVRVGVRVEATHVVHVTTTHYEVHQHTRLCAHQDGIFARVSITRRMVGAVAVAVVAAIASTCNTDTHTTGGSGAVSAAAASATSGVHRRVSGGG